VNGEFERLLGLAADLALRGSAGVLLLGIPVAALALLGWLHRLPRLRIYWQVPVVTRSAAAAGALLGWSVLYADPYGASYRVASVFKVGGPWDISWTTFLRYRGDPGLYDFQALLPVARAPDTDPVFAFVLLAAAVLLVVSVVAALVYLRGWDLVAGLVGIAFICLFSQAFTIYVTALLAYTLNTLNFWAAAVAFVILQYYRRVTKHGGH